MPNSLGSKVAKGAVWSTAQTVSARLIGIAANLILAWFLAREDFGLFGQAATIAAFCEVFGAGGIGTILIVRNQRFHLWSRAAQWLAISLGGAVTLLMVLAGYIISSHPGTERASELFVLVCMMALTPLTRSFSTVPYAKLRIDLRFKRIAIIETLILLASGLLKAILAIIGFGAMSFVLPTVAANFSRTLAMWRSSGVNFSYRPDLRRWKYLLNDSAILILTAFLFKLVTYGDYAVLATFVSLEELGLYFFAFTYSILGVVMLTAGLNSVLVPTFANIKHRSRQISVFVRSSKVLITVICPICFLQSALSEPIISLFFQDKWKPAIILLQILSIGMAGRTVSWLGTSLLESQSRFRTRLWLSATSALVFMAGVSAGASQYGTIGAAIAVAAFYPAMSGLIVFVALRGAESRIAQLANIFFKPVVSSGIAVFLPWLISNVLSLSDSIQLIFISAVSLALYVVLLKVWNNETYNEIGSKLEVIGFKWPVSRVVHSKR